jgi:cytochrome c oxidase subunit II
MSFVTPLFPQEASTMAGRVDALYEFLVGLSIVFTVLIAGLVVYYAVHYRRRRPDEVGTPIRGALRLEVTWTVIPLLITMVIYVWSARVFVAMSRPPAGTINIYVVGKQWMWKFQHLDGQREIDELHVPVDRAVKLTMTSEDVIHSLYVPAFRLKADVVPGRYTTLWFQATKPGSYHLFCAEYCGAGHSHMGGDVVVMEPSAYQRWLTGGAVQGSLASSGQQLFGSLQCNSCHLFGSQGRGPDLSTVFGAQVLLQNGQRVTADEAYIRNSILRPADQVVSGFEPIMPAFQGIVSEEQLLELIEYIKSLHGRTTTEVTP